MMNDEELLLQAANCQTFYVDGFGSFRKINGVLRCVGYILGSGAQMNLIVSLAGADHAYRETQRTLEQQPTKCLSIWSGTALAH